MIDHFKKTRLAQLSARTFGWLHREMAPALLRRRIIGAEVLVRGGEVQTLEGGWNPGRTVVLKFPSVEAAKIYWDSPEYRAARAARAGRGCPCVRSC